MGDKVIKLYDRVIFYTLGAMIFGLMIYILLLPKPALERPKTKNEITATEIKTYLNEMETQGLDLDSIEVRGKSEIYFDIDKNKLNIK
jgi:hypothetical protein